LAREAKEAARFWKGIGGCAARLGRLEVEDDLTGGPHLSATPRERGGRDGGLGRTGRTQAGRGEGERETWADFRPKTKREILKPFLF
jgi:hypothetical protein